MPFTTRSASDFRVGRDDLAHQRDRRAIRLESQVTVDVEIWQHDQFMPHLLDDPVVASVGAEANRRRKGVDNHKRTFSSILLN